jgi:hypothetical protein
MEAVRISSSQIRPLWLFKNRQRIKSELIMSNVAVECYTTSKKVLIRELVNTCYCICELSEGAYSKCKFTILPLYPFLHFHLERALVR